MGSRRGFCCVGKDPGKRRLVQKHPVAGDGKFKSRASQAGKLS